MPYIVSLHMFCVLSNHVRARVNTSTCTPSFGHVLSAPLWIIETSKVPMAVTKVFINMTVNTSGCATQHGKTEAVEDLQPGGKTPPYSSVKMGRSNYDPVLNLYYYKV